MRVAIDAGHGGHDPGALGYGGFPNEKDVVLRVARLLACMIGEDAVMIRGDDTFVRLSDRTRVANEKGVDVFVSIHCNSAGNPDAHGWEVYHYIGSQRGRKLAVAIAGRFRSMLEGRRDRGVKEASFYVLRHTTMPAVLVELEFVSNPGGHVWLSDDGNLATAAAAIHAALMDYENAETERGSSS